MNQSELKVKGKLSSFSLNLGLEEWTAYIHVHCTYDNTFFNSTMYIIFRHSSNYHLMYTLMRDYTCVT